MNDDYLKHYGVPGQRWGVRNYQNKDGSLTNKGRLHYDVGEKTRRVGTAIGKAINMEPTRKLVSDRQKAIANYKKEKTDARLFRRDNGLKRSNSEYKSKMKSAKNNLANRFKKADEDYYKKSSYGQIAVKAMLLAGAGAGAVAVSKLIDNNTWKTITTSSSALPTTRSEGAWMAAEILNQFGQTLLIGGVAGAVGESLDKYLFEKKNNK